MTQVTATETTTTLEYAPDSPAYPDFCQGARCGHIEGKGRAGQYVIGEEGALSYEAADVNVPDTTHRYHIAWALGYQYGYLLAAEGSTLPNEVVNAPLPRD